MHTEEKKEALKLGKCHTVGEAGSTGPGHVEKQLGGRDATSHLIPRAPVQEEHECSLSE